MTSTECQTGCGRPTTARLCTACTHELEEALARLASWSHAPAGVHTGTASALQMPKWREQQSDSPTGTPILLGRKASTAWDTPSGHAALGKTAALAVELDTARARQSATSDANGPRPAPGSKVWAPSTRLDAVEVELTVAVARWVAVLAGVDHGIPQIRVTGATLARGCTLLLWHVHELAVHEHAADAHRAFTGSVDRIERLIDRPADRVYVGPCWEVGADGVKCPTDLYATPLVPEVQCRSCGTIWQVATRQQWLREHAEDAVASPAKVCRVLAVMGLEVSVEHFGTWVSRGRLSPVTRKLVPGREPGQFRAVCEYRVGDAVALAVLAVQARAAGKGRRNDLKQVVA